ncbi:MAG: endonuclease [Cyclobacteriaceae bacterium]|nr:endonuclease [Cyclobacteriaceae bacterium]
MRHSKRHLIFFYYFLYLLTPFYSHAQIPAGYYTTANGKTGYELKTALYNIIKDHNAQGYGDLWDLYPNSDAKPNGKVWDMYSDVPGGTPAYEYTFITDQCGNYSSEGDCYNREHSFPKSWFNDASPMYTDAFHIVPTDGYVNGKRGNLPFGEVGTATFTSTNGSKVGVSNYPGYTGEVFEPIDEYKGDFARGYFYMATRYENVIASWETNNTNGDAMLDGTSDHVFEDWALSMLIEWNNADPVSQKEIDRNDAVYDFQGNRNPFIDHPEYVASIWGGSTSTPVISVTASLTDFGSVAFGEASATQSYTVSGADLTGDILIEASAGFEVSLTDVDASFTSNITLPQTSGSVASTTVYVRFKPTSDSNSNVTGTITHTSSGATTQTINVSGSETQNAGGPIITVTASLTDFGSVAFGEASAAQSYTVSGVDLTDDILVEASAGFEVSLTDVDASFTSNITLSQTSGSVASTIVYVRFKPASNSNTNETGTLTHTSNGAENVVVNVSGTEVDDVIVIPKLNFSFSSRTTNPIGDYEVQLYADVAPQSDLEVAVSLTDGINIQYGNDFSTSPELTNGSMLLTWPAGKLTASFLIHFNEDWSAFNDPGFIEFEIETGNGYTIGSNNTFILNVEKLVNGVNDGLDSGLTIFPNPAHQRINVVIKNRDVSYLITDLSGRTIQGGEMPQNMQIGVGNLQPGNYLIHLISVDGRNSLQFMVY